MKAMILVFSLMASQGAEALIKLGGFSADLDMQLGAQGQMNPPTEYTQITAACCPPAKKSERVPFYQHHLYIGNPTAYSQWGFESKLDIRVLIDYASDAFEFKINELLNGFGRYQNQPFGIATGDGTHRSIVLPNHSYSYAPEDGGASFVTDQLWLKWIPIQTFEIILGRQPLNLATNHYFSPNDLFSPFSPDDFLRLYKEGEDALRFTEAISPLAQFELIAVAGYERVYFRNIYNVREETFAPEFAKRKSSLLGHMHASNGPLAIGALFGWDASRDLCGLSLERDLGSSWMLGFEGNISRYDDDPGRNWYDASIGLSRQLGPELMARVEFASSPSFPVCPYCMALEREQRSLNALGLDWQSSGLWQGGFVNLSDLDRWEGLLSWNARRSLSDEVDLIIGGGIPWRLPKERPSTATVFELAPLSLNLQIRWVL